MKHLESTSLVTKELIDECGPLSRDECGPVYPIECVVNRVAEEYSNKPYSHELSQDDVRYIASGVWDLHKSQIS